MSRRPLPAIRAPRSRRPGPAHSASRASARRPRRGLRFGDEMRWTLTHRRGWLLGFAVNLVTAALFVGYSRFETNSGALRLAGLAAGLAGGGIASTLSTNQLGEDAEHVLDRLQSQKGITPLLVVKSLVLATLLLPITIAVSIAAQIDLTRLHQLFTSVTEDLLDVFVVLIWLGVGSVTSVLLPYRPLPLRERLRKRSGWLRWVVYLTLPYLLFFAVIPAVVWPPRRRRALVRCTAHQPGGIRFDVRALGPFRVGDRPRCFSAVRPQSP